jgi:site-specific recombinase XerD
VLLHHLAQRQDLLATNPARRLERRKPARRGDRAIPRTRLETLFTDPVHALRERVLGRLLYDTAARAEESSPSTSKTST